MKSIFRGLEWLSTDEAMQYLQLLSSIQMTEKLFLKQCEARDCPVYVDVDGASGWDESRSKPATAKGTHKLEFTDAFGMGCRPRQLHTTGVTRWGEGVTRWKIDLRIQKQEFPWMFKPADIEALATKINGTPAPAEKPLHPSERKSAGQIIATLAAMAGLDLSAPYKADGILRTAAATHCLELPSSTETVVKYLKDAAASTDKD